MITIASNLLKQINSKLGGDLYCLKVPPQVSQYTMLIGIDVCHSGSKSIVGFCASFNKELSQYYSQCIVQKKKQEIIGAKLIDALKTALDVYLKKSGFNRYPDHFIIYRDGVGDAMRNQVIETEISQF